MANSLLVRLAASCLIALGTAAHADAAEIDGEISFPGRNVPPMTAYACEIDTSKILTTAIARDQRQFSVEVPPGRYVVFLAPSTPGAPNVYGAYTQYSACAQHPADGGGPPDAACPDHGLLTFSLGAKSTRAAILIDDWYLSDEVAAQLDRIRGIEPSGGAEPLSAPRFSDTRPPPMTLPPQPSSIPLRPRCPPRTRARLSPGARRAAEFRRLSERGCPALRRRLRALAIDRSAQRRVDRATGAARGRGSAAMPHGRDRVDAARQPAADGDAQARRCDCDSSIICGNPKAPPSRCWRKYRATPANSAPSCRRKRDLVIADMSKILTLTMSGLVTVLPLAFTVYVIWWLVHTRGDWLRRALIALGIVSPEHYWPGLGLYRRVPAAARGRQPGQRLRRHDADQILGRFSRPYSVRQDLVWRLSRRRQSPALGQRREARLAARGDRSIRPCACHRLRHARRRAGGATCARRT